MSKLLNHAGILIGLLLIVSACGNTSRNDIAMRQAKIAYEAGYLDLQDALAEYEKAIALDPANGYIYYNRGRHYARDGYYAHAIADFDQALSLHPRSDPGWYNLFDVYAARGSANAAQGDFAQAIADFSKALELNPSHGPIYLQRGITYLAKGECQKAVDDFDWIIQERPTARNYLYRAQAYACLGDHKRAAEDAEAALQAGNDADAIREAEALLENLK